MNAPSPKEIESSTRHQQLSSKSKPSRKPLQILPKSLVDQIQLQKSNSDNIPDSNDNRDVPKPVVSGRVMLKDVKRSDSSKWMRPKGDSPEKQDMKSHLEKSLGNMR